MKIYILEDLLPIAMESGMTYHHFMHSTLKAVLSEIDGYNARKKNEYESILYSAWLFGTYTAHAIQATVGNSGWFHRKGAKPNEYPENPLMAQEQNSDKLADGELSDEDKKKYTEQFFAKLRLLGVNHKLSKQNNSNEQEENVGSDQFNVE